MYTQTHIQYDIEKYICLSPTPAEKGEFLALDLGGTNFKVLQVKVREGKGIKSGGVEMEEKIYPIPKDLLSGRGTEVGRRRRNKGRWIQSRECRLISSLLLDLLSLCSCLTILQSL